MKTKLIQSTILLFIVSFIAKLLSFIIKIQLAKTMNQQTMVLYTLSSSTMIFLITFVQAGLPSTLNTLIAKSKNTISILQNSLFISFFTNTIAIGIYVFTIPYLTNNTLEFNQTPVLLSIIPLLPLVTISGLCKGYCLGKQKIILANSSAITEEVLRMLFLVICYPYVYQSPTLYASFSILSIAIGEMGAILHILLFMNNTNHISQLFVKKYVSQTQIKEILSYAIYMTSSRFIGSFTHFLEPFLFNLPSHLYLQAHLITTFSYIHAYVLPIITLPSFFTFALSSWLLSSLSYHVAHHQIKQAKKILYYVLGISFSIGIFGSTICYLFPTQLTQLFYNNTQSAYLLKQLALPFAIFSLQSPLSTALHAFDKSKFTVIDTAIGNTIKLLLIIILPAYCGATSLILAMIISMLFTTLLHAYHVYGLLHNQP